MRNSFNFGVDAMYLLRGVVANEVDRRAFPNSQGVTLMGREDGTFDAIAISGHLINIFLSSHFIPFDFKRYMNVVHSNLQRVAGVRKINRDYDALRKSGLIGDIDLRPAENILWHTYEEYTLALKVYEVLAENVLRVQPSRAVAYVRSKLDGFASRYPQFRERHMPKERAFESMTENFRSLFPLDEGVLSVMSKEGSL